MTDVPVSSKQLRLELIQALRDTKYKQCRDRLYFGYEYVKDDKGRYLNGIYLEACALGVALDVLRKHYPDEEDIISWDAKRFINRFEFNFGEPPHGAYTVITKWNDKDELTFKQIADELEEREKDADPTP